MEKGLIFSIMSCSLYIIGAIPYWKDVLKGRTIPHVFSVLVWFILVGFNCHVLLIQKEWYGLIPGIIMTISLLFGIFFGIKWFRKIQINWFDYFCLSLAILLLIYYFFFRNIRNAVLLTASIDLIAFLPTFKKGWLQPWTESILIYFLASMNQVFTILTFTEISLENSFFWGYIFFANLIFFFMVAARRYYLKGWNSIFE